jgi:prevent-host-death family protein
MPSAKPAVVSVAEARKHLGELITAAAQNGTVTVTSKNGIPACALVPLDVIRRLADDSR